MVRYGCRRGRFMASKKPVNAGYGNHAGGGTGDGGDDCDIVIDCDLSGIRPEILARVRKGDRLYVRVEPGEPYRSVVCITAEGGIVGALTAFPGHGRLIRCLERGVIYGVVVQNVGAGRCHVVGGPAS